MFVDDDKVIGVIDWSEASQGDALYDLASLTLGHEEHLGTDCRLIMIESPRSPSTVSDRRSHFHG